MTDAQRISRASAWVRSQIWAIEPEALQLLIDIASRDHIPDFEAVAAKRGQLMDRTQDVVMRDGGVAVIDMTGPIFRYASFFTRVSGATSIESIALDFRAALDNPAVRSIVLNVDSPGGGVAGISEFAGMVRDSAKPVHSYIGGTGGSAAYWIASAASRIVMSDTAQVGSIGVVAGIRVNDDETLIEIVSTQSPDKRVDARTSDGRQKIQATIDEIAQVFVETVAANRKVDVATVLAEFGRGGVKTGKNAVAAGMADSVGSLESVIAELAGSASNTNLYRRLAMSTAKGPITVATTAELHAAGKAGHRIEEITVASADLEPIRKEAHDKGFVDGKAAGATEGTAAERARILSIQSIAQPGFDKEIAAAIESGATADETAVSILRATKAKGVTLAAIAADGSQVVPHAGAQRQTQGQSTWGKAVGKFGGK
jgi:ClpP class serine protease